VDDNDKPVPISKLLDDTREITTNFTLQKVIRSDFSESISKLTRFYILWRWAFGEKIIPFDDARKLAHSVGFDLDNEWNKSFIIKKKESVQVLGPQDRILDDINSEDLIDILHTILILWRKNKKEELKSYVKKNGYENSEMLKRVAQSISSSLSLESVERNWVDGFLTGLRTDDSQNPIQTKLF
jgi:hypothetical protein